MSSITIINKEYIYKFKLFYRKTFPDLEYFYLLVTFIKYFPVILFTHAIQPNCSNHPSLFTLSKIIKAFLVIHPPFNISYTTLCIVLYCILLLLIIGALFVFIKYKNLSKHSDYTLY